MGAARYSPRFAFARRSALLPRHFHSTHMRRGLHAAANSGDFMKYRYLGRSGLLVSRLCLGTMTFGNPEWGCDQKTSSAIVRRFIEGGGNFIDTADGYSGGESEKMLGVALKEHDRDNLVIATKCWFPSDAAVDGARPVAQAHRRILRQEPAAHGYRLHRPLPVPRTRPLHAAGGEPPRGGRSHPRRQDPLSRLLELLWLADRQGQRHRRAQELRAAGLGAASLQSGPPRHRARDPARLRRSGPRP